MYSGAVDRRLILPGFPIRISTDHSLFASSPRLIAGYHVLHRLKIPRHPPYALNQLNLVLFNLSKERFVLVRYQPTLGSAIEAEPLDQ
jgi:hypothetical protein